MARPSWTNVTPTDVDVDSPGKTDTLFAAMNDNTAAGRILLFGVDIAEDTTTSGTPWDTVANSTFYLHIPNVGAYTGIDRKITLTVWVKTTSGDTGSYRIYNVTNSTAGDTITSASGLYVKVDLTLDIEAGWLGSEVTCRLEFYRSIGSTGTVYLRAEDMSTGRIEY